MEKWLKDIELRNALMDSFKDTCKMCSEDISLAHSVKTSVDNQQIHYDATVIDYPHSRHKNGKITVTSRKTMEAAAAHKGMHVAVLNFASPFSPGGGVHIATLTQEECLCRETTLWPCISVERCIDDFYGRHEQSASNWLGNADMIYTPDVKVFKSPHKIPELMDESDWYDIDVITMSAPIFSWAKTGGKISDDKMIDVFVHRFEKIVQKAADENVDVLILGAFGCGAFGNDPAIVAAAAARVMETYKCTELFDVVEFACYGPGKKNYRMFRLVLDRYLNPSV